MKYMSHSVYIGSFLFYIVITHTVTLYSLYCRIMVILHFTVPL